MKGEYNLVHGIAEEIQNYPLTKADLILCDPPFKPKLKQYQQVRKKNKVQLSTILTPDNFIYDDWWEDCLAIWKYLLKDSGYLVFKADDYTAREIYSVTKKYFNYYCSVIWNKRAIGLGAKIRKMHENLEIYTPIKAKKLFWAQKTISHTSNHGDSQGIAFKSIIDVLTIKNGYRGQLITQDHINQTPIAVWEPFLKYMCPQNGLVLDPFMGSGSILAAILKKNRLQSNSYSYWGIECDKKNYAIAKALLPGKDALDRFLTQKRIKTQKIEVEK